MAKIIVYTNTYNIGEQQIPHQDYGLNGNNFILFKQDCCSEPFTISNTPKDISKYDFLFIADIEWTENLSKLKEIVKNFIGQVKSHDIYVILHKNSGFNNDKSADAVTSKGNKSIVKDIVEDSKYDNFIEDSHIGNSIYHDQLLRLTTLEKNDKDSYAKVIEEIKNKFPDARLEAKLNLLHQCLTPQGAKEANPDWLQPEAQAKFDNLKKINDDNPFAKEYIDALTELRDVLLKEY